MPGYESLIQPPGVGRLLAGRYRLVAPIARGGMAEVWEAHDEVLARPVAAKVLQAHLAADQVFLERFRREAVTAARLAHPGIVATFDTGYDQGTAFIVMELVRGRNLRQWIDVYERMEPWQAVAVTRQVADALAYAHQAGLVHRDVKPANILLVDDEWGGLRVKVTDFGIAKAGQEMGGDLTRTGIVLGTPKYLSPEQLRGGDPDPRADLYSLGVVLYEMLVGRPPFQGDTDMATALAHLGERVPKPSASVRGVPAGVDRVVMDLLAKTPDKRVQSALELRRRLDGLGPLAPPSGGGPAAGRHRARRRHDHDGRPAVPGPGPEVRPPTAAAGGWGAPAGAPRMEMTGPGALAGGGSAGEGPGGIGADGGAGTGVFAVPLEADPTALIGSRPAPPTPTGPTVAPAPPTRVGGPAPAGEARFGAVAPAPAPPAPAGSVGGGWHGPPVANGSGPGTEQFPAVTTSKRRSGRMAGLVVLTLVVVAALVAADTVLTSGSSGRHSPGRVGSTVATGTAVRISGVSVYMDNSRPPDDPNGTIYTYDGNPDTAWSTDHYSSPHFGNLYDGIGLEIALAGSATLRSLRVTSPTVGWSASTYVSSGPIASGQPVSVWGHPTATLRGIDGNATFDLAGRKGAYVLLWITDLGPADQASVAELSVTG